jgi:hypothetical protein
VSSLEKNIAQKAVKATARHTAGGRAPRLLAIVTDPIEGEEAVEQIRARAVGDAAVRLVAPAVEPTVFRHTLGDIDEATRRAEQVVESSLRELRRSGVEVSGTVGDPDPVLAAEDALREGPVDQIVIFEHEGGQARWFEDGLFERAQERLEPPLSLVLLHEDAEGAHVVGVEDAAAGTAEPEQPELQLGGNLPNFSRGDLAGMAIGVVGTIVVAVLAAAAGTGSGPEAGWKAVAIGVAIATALINMAHVVGLTLFESVRYRGGFERLFRTLSLVGTPLAILVNTLIVLLA